MEFQNKKNPFCETQNTSKNSVFDFNFCHRPSKGFQSFQYPSDSSHNRNYWEQNKNASDVEKKEKKNMLLKIILVLVLIALIHQIQGCDCI